MKNYFVLGSLILALIISLNLVWCACECVPGQEWEQVTVAAPAQALLVKSIELIDELQMLQLIPAANFTASLTLPLQIPFSLLKMQKTALCGMREFLTNDTGSQVLMQLWVHMDRSETPFCNSDTLILTHCI